MKLIKRMLIVNSVLLMLVYSGLTTAQTIEVQGILTGAPVADTLLIVGNVSVPLHEMLDLSNCRFVLANRYHSMDIRGSLTARGTVEEPIFFGVADTSGFSDYNSDRGGWGGLIIDGTNSGIDSVVLENCVFSHGKTTGASSFLNGGIIKLDSRERVRFTNCSFRNNHAFDWGGAIFVNNSHISFINCEFENNTCGQEGPPYGYGGAVCLISTWGEIRLCRFSDNNSTGIGGALSLEYSDVLVAESIFTNNRSGLGGALGYMRSAPLLPVAGCLFTGNGSRFFGGAIASIEASPMYLHNTITANYSEAYGGGMYCNEGASPVSVNTILYNNTAPEGQEVYIWDLASAPAFYNCNIRGGREAFSGTGAGSLQSPYENNIDTLPGFQETIPHPFGLFPDSPCIDKGLIITDWTYYPVADLAGNPRISGALPDIGAYEYQHGLSVPEQEEIIHFTLCPIPFSSELHIYKSIASRVSGVMIIYDISGCEIVRSHILKPGETFSWDGTLLSGEKAEQGVYIIRDIRSGQTAKAIKTF